jgi:hypothetical protein
LRRVAEGTGWDFKILNHDNETIAEEDRGTDPCQGLDGTIDISLVLLVCVTLGCGVAATVTFSPAYVDAGDRDYESSWVEARLAVLRAVTAVIER